MKRLLGIFAVAVATVVVGSAGFAVASHTSQIETHVIPWTIGTDTGAVTIQDTDVLPHETITVTTTQTVTTTNEEPPPATGQVLWNADFEDGTLGGFSVEAKDPSRVKIVSSPVRHGTRSVQLEVLPTDTNVFNSGAFVRTGLNHPTFDFAGHEGQENWYAWSVYYPSSTPHSRGGMVDWHTSASVTEPDGSGAGDFVSNWPEGMSLDVYGQCCAPDGAHPGTTHWGDHWLDQPMKLDHWYDIVFHIKWSVDPGVGFYELFMDGTRRVARRSASTLFVKYPSTRLKMQIYRPVGTINVAERVYFDNPRVATTWASAVADFGGWPSSPPS